ncbi:6-carboxytetrahydropterin synthase QueD [Roseovarius sp. C7]|uniref:6-carboxytetrahydropterin synthase QueD n=1 Tax=Roseovarius sp. C7 TaxID=3398643 RepID=UPI0039F5AD7E
MYRICKEFHFSASHQLTHLPEGHQCARLHGHNYVVAVELAAPALDANGFVRDYHELAALKSYIDAEFDHRHLNDVLDEPSTAETLARHFFDWCAARWAETTAVRVSETPRSWAEYRP